MYIVYKFTLNIFPFLMVSFQEQKFLNFLKSTLSIAYFRVCVFYLLFKNNPHKEYIDLIAFWCLEI
jgi:branched-subunit amino acid transport protein AzlD